MQLRNITSFSLLAATMLFAQQQPARETTAQPSTPSAAPAGQATPGEPLPPMLGPQDMKFLTETVRGGMMEIQVAQMAQQKAASEEVKKFARQLEQDHSKANDQLKMIAKERAVELPTDLGEHQKMITPLGSLSGSEFDRQFAKMQIKHHKKDVSAFRKEVKNSMDSDLRDFATTTLPVVEGHLRQAESLASQSRSN